MDDEQRVQLDQQQQDKAQLVRKRDMEWMLASERGRRILFELIEGTRAFETSFTGNSGAFFNDGRKSVGLEFFHEVMGIAPDSFTLMWNEHQERLKDIQRELTGNED